MNTQQEFHYATILNGMWWHTDDQSEMADPDGKRYYIGMTIDTPIGRIEISRIEQTYNVFHVYCVRQIGSEI